MPCTPTNIQPGRRRGRIPGVCIAALWGFALGACTMASRAPESLGADAAQAGAGGSASTQKERSPSEGPTNAPASDGAKPADGSSSTSTGSAASGGSGGSPSTQPTAGKDAATGGAANSSSANTSSGAANSSNGGSGGSASGAASSSTSSPSTAGAGGATRPDDAGTPDAGSVSSAKLEKCNSDLAQCIIDAPLNYDGCLRKNADNGCPEPDSGVPTQTTPVLDENGNPISQACQAELAKCIMKNPTPANALECTETARKCK